MRSSLDLEFQFSLGHAHKFYQIEATPGAAALVRSTRMRRASDQKLLLGVPLVAILLVLVATNFGAPVTFIVSGLLLVAIGLSLFIWKIRSLRRDLPNPASPWLTRTVYWIGYAIPSIVITLAGLLLLLWRGIFPK